MKFCAQCGAEVRFEVPEGDNRERAVCGDCQTIHYSNPKNVVGALLYRDDRILLARRAIEPRYGKWTIPAGFMENGETVLEAAQRETWEEARARSDSLKLMGVYSLPHISQVYLFFYGELANEDFEPGDESLETRLFRRDEIPWEELSFSVVQVCLEFLYSGRFQQTGTPQLATIIRQADNSISVHSDA